MRIIFCVLTALLLSNFCFAAENDKDSSKSKSKVMNPDPAVTGEAQLLTQFLLRGLAYSDHNPAMNASFQTTQYGKLKLGLWGSNISNLGAADDNFWLKLFGKIRFDLNDKNFMNVYLENNNFYKSSQWNGVNMGVDFNYKSYEFGLELISNLEGSKSGAEYLWFGKLFDYKTDFRYGGYAGLTLSQSAAVATYFDFKVLGQYLLSSNSTAETGITLNSNPSQFGKRGDPAFYLSIKLVY